MEARYILKKMLPLEGIGTRHYGLTKALGAVYEEAASVRLSSHHSPPRSVSIVDGEREMTVDLTWRPATKRTRAAFANLKDATEQGAYGMALAAIELMRGCVAIHRAEQGTRVDYYLAPVGADYDDLESSIRLEVSGIDSATEGKLKTRLKEKLWQAKKGAANTPAIAAVVGFSNLRILCADIA